MLAFLLISINLFLHKSIFCDFVITVSFSNQISSYPLSGIEGFNILMSILLMVIHPYELKLLLRTTFQYCQWLMDKPK